jgi:hypothetical protein
MFCKPPLWEAPTGKPRRVGFEFELAGIEPAPLVATVQELFGGEVAENNPIHYTIATDHGDFTVELDAQPMQKMAGYVQEAAQDLPEDALARQMIQAGGKLANEVAATLVPYEIVTPPLDFEQFAMLDDLTEALRKQQGKGTRDSLFYAFGLHINPEVYDDSAAGIRDVLRAFMLLYPWLLEVMEVDVSRRITPYIDPFPDAYLELVLPPEYAPDLPGLVEDYLKHNATRNRALDCLPLFRELVPDQLDGLDEDTLALVKARPTFHYRLPNYDVSNPNWQVADDWNHWVRVEALAQDTEKLAQLSRDYLEYMQAPFHRGQRDWVEKIATEAA